MKKIGLIVLILVGVGISSCKKEGCTSSVASNFDEKAKEDDGSCQFSGSIFTSFNTFTKSNLLDDGINFLEVYVDGSLIGVINVNAYSPGSNLCNSSNVAAKTMNWVGVNSKNYFVDYRDQSTGLLVKSTTVTVYATGCYFANLNY